MPDTTANAARPHDVQALRARQRAAQEAVQPLILEMAQIYSLYTTLQSALGTWPFRRIGCLEYQTA